MSENQSTVRHAFNSAIDFAIREGIGAAVFLDAWRHGDTSEWPEFDTTPTIDLDEAAWDAIKLAADQSTWIPQDHYTMNEWVADVCGFLRDGPSQESESAARILELQQLLLRAEDAIEGLDGTNVENEKLVDDFRNFKKGLPK